MAQQIPAIQCEDDIPIEPKANPNAMWRVTHVERLSACQNRPGLKKLYLRIVDDKGEGLSGIKVRFGWESGKGMAYDQPNVWGVTDDQGFIEWDSFGVPTRYSFYIEGDEDPLVENIRVDLGYEYCSPSAWPPKSWVHGWIPVNRPGIYSYRFVVQQKPN